MKKKPLKSRGRAKIPHVTIPKVKIPRKYLIIAGVALAGVVVLGLAGLGVVKMLPHQLTVSISPAGSGSVNTSGKEGQASFHGTVTLNATPSQGYRFDHWEGGAYGIANQVAVTMNSNKQVTAVFVSPQSVTVPTIEVATAKGILDHAQNVVFVDVRSQSEYQTSHIPGAISVPYADLQDKYTEIPAGKQVIIYAACH